MIQLSLVAVSFVLVGVQMGMQLERWCSWRAFTQGHLKCRERYSPH